MCCLDQVHVLLDRVVGSVSNVCLLDQARVFVGSSCWICFNMCVC